VLDNLAYLTGRHVGSLVRATPHPLSNFYPNKAVCCTYFAEASLTAPFLVNSRSVSIIELALPHLKHLDPKRVGLIMAAPQRVQMIQREGAILMMPEMRSGLNRATVDGPGNNTAHETLVVRGGRHLGLACCVL
jgi:hypothetical protein